MSPQYPYRNSPDSRSFLYIFLKYWLRQIHIRSKHFSLGDHFSNSHNYFLDYIVYVLIITSLGENWHWWLLGLTIIQINNTADNTTFTKSKLSVALNIVLLRTVITLTYTGYQTNHWRYHSILPPSFIYTLCTLLTF